jgi:hypothetical protein
MGAHTVKELGRTNHQAPKVTLNINEKMEADLIAIKTPINVRHTPKF